MRKLCLCLLLIASGLSAERDSAFVQDHGGFHGALQACFYRSSRRFDDNAHVFSDGVKFDYDQYTLYAEYGITEHSTLQGRVIFADLADNFVGATTGFEEFELGWKRIAYLSEDGCHAVAVQLLAVLPGGNIATPSYRLGRFGGEFDLLYSTDFPFWQWSAAAHLKAGYRWYFGHPSDQARCSGQLLWRVAQWLHFLGRGEMEWGVNNGSDEITTAFRNNSQYRLVRVTGSMRIVVSPRLTFHGDYFEHVWGERVGSGGGWCVGFFTDY